MPFLAVNDGAAPQGWSGFGGVLSFSETMARGLAAAYADAPAVTLALVMLIVLPLIAVAGLVGHSLLSARRAVAPSEAPRELVPQWPAEAWLIADRTGLAWRMARHGLMRLGRDEDNEVCLPLDSVNRYHAIIHQPDGARFVITDVSSAAGQGVMVNGRRAAEAELRHGDRIRIGLAELVFVARPA